MNAAAASDLLLHKTGSDLSYIHRMQSYQQKTEQEKKEQEKRLRQTAGAGPAAGSSPATDGSVRTDETDAKRQQAELRSNAVYRAVLQGEKNSIINYAQQELARGQKPEQIINEYLIPAINEVGELFNEQKYFLPQLIASANAMKLNKN